MGPTPEVTCHPNRGILARDPLMHEDVEHHPPLKILAELREIEELEGMLR
jgi:hypothetical protein